MLTVVPLFSLLLAQPVGHSVFVPRTPADARPLMESAVNSPAAQWCVTAEGTPPLAGQLKAELTRRLAARHITVVPSGCQRTVGLAYLLTDSGSIMGSLLSVGFTLNLSLSDEKGTVLGRGTTSSNIPCIDKALAAAACRDRAVTSVEGAVGDLLASSKALSGAGSRAGTRKPLAVVIQGAPGTEPKLVQRLGAHLKEALAPLGFDVGEDRAAGTPEVNLSLTVKEGAGIMGMMKSYDVAIAGSVTDAAGTRELTSVGRKVPCINASLTPVSCWSTLAAPLKSLSDDISKALGGAQSRLTTQNKLPPARLGTLAWAAQAGDMDLLREQILADPLAIKSERAPTALDHAADANQLQAAELIMQQGGISLLDRYQDSAVHHAARHKDAAMLRLLRRYGAPVDPVGSGGDMPLHLAAQSGGVDGVTFLLSQGAPADSVNQANVNALWNAAQAGTLPVVDALLRTPGVTVDRRPRRGDSTLLLLADGAAGQVLEAAVALARKQKSPLATRFDAPSMVAYQKDRKVFGQALSTGDANTVATMLGKWPEFATMFLDRQEPLVMAVGAKAPEPAVAGVVSQLLAKGAPASGSDEADKYDVKPLEAAVLKPFPSVVKALLKAGASPDALTAQGPVGCRATDPAVRAVLEKNGFSFSSCQPR